ncbi:MAG: AI-2E family transporter [Syntrophales bacterium]|jgi:predicted PurR-regulated permease PerM|nr:AI-2E family transporter [Syntrophales bacterium]MDY0045669.1 AI-2E family transporter [Syntrophales bacterium]
MTSSRWGLRLFLLAVLFLSLYLAFLLVKPFIHTIIISVLLASLIFPLKGHLLRFFHGRRNVTALMSVVIITFLIVIPVLVFIAALVSQAVDTINDISDWINEGNLERLLKHGWMKSVIDWFKVHLEFVEFRQSDVQSYLLQGSKNVGQFVIEQGAALLGNVTSLVFHFFVIIFITFFLIRDGEEMLGQIKYLAPLREEQKNQIIGRIKAVSRSALLGTFLTALCQAIVGGIGFAIVGIPALFWGTVLGFSSLVPVVGTSLVSIPAIGYLVITGKTAFAIFLAIWSVVLVGSVDNFVRPFFMRGEGRMSTFYIFLAIIGGIDLFGLMGLVYGPLILGFASVMIYIYRVEYSDMLDGNRNMK